MSLEEHNYSSPSPVSPRPPSPSPHPHSPHTPPPPPFRVPVPPHPLSSPQISFQSVPPAWGNHGQSSPTGQWGNSSSCGVKYMDTNLPPLYQYVPVTPTPQMELHSQSKHLGVPSTTLPGPSGLYYYLGKMGHLPQSSSLGVGALPQRRARELPPPVRLGGLQVLPGVARTRRMVSRALA